MKYYRNLPYNMGAFGVHIGISRSIKNTFALGALFAFDREYADLTISLLMIHIILNRSK